MPELETLPLAILSLTIFAVNFGYFALFETFWRGQSPGKHWVGLRVVKDGGFALDGRAALVRNLLRIVDFLPAFYVAGMTSIFLTRSGKRIGDYAAGTIVVRERKVGNLALVAAPSPDAQVSNALGARGGRPADRLPRSPQLSGSPRRGSGWRPSSPPDLPSASAGQCPRTPRPSSKCWPRHERR